MVYGKCNICYQVTPSTIKYIKYINNFESGCYCNVYLHNECFLTWYKNNKNCIICKNNYVKKQKLYFNKKIVNKIKYIYITSKEILLKILKNILKILKITLKILKVINLIITIITFIIIITVVWCILILKVMENIPEGGIRMVNGKIRITY